MPSIVLPRDDRWGDLGKGLGQFGAALYQKQQQDEATAGVAEIMQNPTIAPADKAGEAWKKFGALGGSIFTKMQDTQVKQAQLKDALATAGLRTAQTALVGAQAQKEGATIPYAGQQAAANLASTNAKIEAERAATNRDVQTLGPDLEAKSLANATNAALQTPKVDIARSEATKTNAEAQLLKIKVEQLTKGGFSVDQMNEILSTSAFKDIPAPVRAAAVTAGAMETDPVKRGEAMMKPINTYIERRASSDIPNDQVQRRNESDAAAGESALKFMNAFRQDPSKTGMLSGANIQAGLEHWGLPTGDAQAIQMRITSLRQAASEAMSGGTFYSTGRFQVAKDVNPSTTETPLFAVMSADETADRKLVELNNRAARYPGDNSTKENVEAWKKVKDITGSLKTYVADGRTVVMFDGNQVDAKTFKPLIEGKKKYGDATGLDIITAVQEWNTEHPDQPPRDPYQWALSKKIIKK